ncbi:MAG: hypothetical protein K6B17_07295 [Treponema sp.]|nr:hypothetical protein [Treponema sp.]
MKKIIIKILSTALIMLAISACKREKKELISNYDISFEKMTLQKNIEKILNDLDFQNKYSVSIIYQQTKDNSKRAISEENITRRVYGKADFSEKSDTPNNVDGMWEEKLQRANYDEKKESDKIEYGYFSAIIIIDEIDKETQDKLNALMNYSVANSARGDVINVISKSDFSARN